MNRTLRGAATMTAVVLGVGALAAGATAVAEDANDRIAKREDSVTAVLTADVDDDGDSDRSRGSDSGGTNSIASANNDSSGVSHDGTNSRNTGVSRNGDRSRGDLTKDWTQDGGDRTRDHSRHQTNDGSRNDTR